MPVSAETLRLLMDAGVEGDELLRIVESIDRTQTKERSANAERQARHRAKKLAESVTDNVINNVTESVTPHVRVEENLKTNKQTGKKKNHRQEQADFELELSAILDAERVSALVDVRRKKGGKLNGHAARLLIAKINTCGLSPADAADTMVLRNWISIESDWLRRGTASATAPPKKLTQATMWHEEARNHGILNDPPSQTDRHLDASLPRGQDQGSGFARRIASA